jgi:hypothetical protein
MTHIMSPWPCVPPCSTMRAILVAISVLIAALALPLGAGLNRVSPSVLTVILDFKGPHSRTSLKEMERESGLILRSSGVNLDWHMLGDDPYASYPDLVVMTFRGDCQYKPAARTCDAPGPLAVTHESDGEILPFGEVDCDRVVDSARSAMTSIDYPRADLLVGRALGRVVAHELVHMITKSGQHAKEGVERPSLSGRQLITESLPLSAVDVDRVKFELQGR